MISRVEAFLARYPIAAAVAYGAVVVLLVAVTVDTIVQVLQRREAAAAAAEILSQIELHDAAREPAVRADLGAPLGSPFLEGTTVSVAGAALLQRVTAATKKVNGNTLSSQVDLQGREAKSGFIMATSSFEIDSTQLQPLLYDLEAGMPFLFVDELVVQASTGSTQSGKLRVLLGVSGQRRSSK